MHSNNRRRPFGYRPMRALRCATAALLLGPCIAAAQNNAPTTHIALDRQWMQPSVRPQDDLYGAAAGGKGEVLPFDIWNVVEDGVTDAKHARADLGTPKQRIADLYTSYMDEGTIDALGCSPLSSDFARIDAIRTPQDIAAVTGFLATINVPAPFAVKVQSDGRFGRFKVVIDLADETGFRDNGVTDIAPYALNRPRKERYAARLFELCGDVEARENAASAMALERDIINARAATKDALHDAAAATTDSAEALTSGATDFPWRDFYAASGLTGRLHTFEVHEPAEVIAASNTLARAPLSAIKAYLKYFYLNNRIEYLPRSFRQANLDFWEFDPFDGAPRHQRGLFFVNLLLNRDIEREYLPPALNTEQRAYAKSIFSQVKGVVREKVLNATWLTGQRRTLALHRLDTVTLRLGGSDQLNYEHLVIAPNDLLGNVQRAFRVIYNFKLSKLDTPPNDRAAPDEGQDEVRYWCDINRVNMPDHYLRTLDFQPNKDDGALYGNFGFFSGHELVHAIELTEGCDCNRPGQCAGDTPGNSHEEEMKRELVAQYSYTTESGRKINGARSLHENIADIVGMDAAYIAYQRATRGHASPVIDGLTSNQRFFYAFAQFFRRNPYTEEQTGWAYPRADIRVNTTVRNIQGFYDAFDVKSSDKAYLPPERRVIFY